MALGENIATLRKARGLTQEKLVVLCQDLAQNKMRSSAS